MVQKELIEKLTTEQLRAIVNEFFIEHFWVDFSDEVLGETSIPNVEEFARDYFIEQICDNCTKDELVESGWLFEDEGTEEEWINNQIDN